MTTSAPGWKSACPILWAAVALTVLMAPAGSADYQDRPEAPLSLLRGGFTYRLTVPAVSAWSDTQLDAVEGQQIGFQASGSISLQRGNPIALCGPDGFNRQTVQQPLRDRNIGAVVGKIVQLISIEVDEETGEEKRNERIEYFYVGSRSRVRIPMNGRLFLGINEHVVDDNAGEFQVVFFLENPSL